MANVKHLELLKQGLAVWNKWRLESPQIRPNLSGATINDPLSKWAFGTAVSQHLGALDLSRSNLRRCVLRKAALAGADLSGADLRGADLRMADLTGTRLVNASLHQANLTLANLSHADLSNALFWETILARTQLRNAMGLETCRHGGPSIVDHRTYAKSPGVPNIFWRSCGVPDRVLAAFREMSTRKLRFLSCFISYSAADDEFVKKLHADLRSHGVDCWIAFHDLKGGIPLDEQITSAESEYDRVLLVLSDASMRSSWVATEVQTARQREREQGVHVLFPIAIVSFSSVRPWTCFDTDTGEDVAKAIRRYPISDFSAWTDAVAYRQALDRLLHDLSGRLPAP